MKPSLFPLFVSLAAAQNVRRQLAAGGQLDNTFCIEEAYGGSLGCTANDINIVDATNIVIKDDGCAFPGDTVTFTADFQVSSSATTRFDIGLYLVRSSFERKWTQGKRTCLFLLFVGVPRR